MTLELQGNMLGLGSIVRIDRTSASGLFVIVARGAYRPDKGSNEVLPRYLVAPHPHGEAPDQETFPVLVSDIAEVVFDGYSDAADAIFLADLLHQMENGARSPQRAQRFTEPLTAMPERGGALAASTHEAAIATDPFWELRRLVHSERQKGVQ